MLNIKNLSYKYDNTKINALNSISFNLKPGEIVGLLGHNGAGKSTLLECVSGLKKPTLGTIHIDNSQINNCDKISFVPNDLYLYNMLTIKETLFFMGRIHSLNKKQIESITEPLISTFSLEEKLNEYMKDLSYGMKQQVSLILGILSSPQYLLLDEPMNGFDTLSTKNTKDFLENYSFNNGTGILLSSHRLDIVEDICSRLIVINRGNLIYEGSMSDLKNNLSFEEALLSVTGDNK